MFAHRRMRFAGLGLRRASSVHNRLGPLLMGCVLALLLQACAAPPPAPFAGPDPADPSVRVPPAAYRSATGSYRSQRPVEPAAWDEQNERVAPAPKR